MNSLIYVFSIVIIIDAIDLIYVSFYNVLLFAVPGIFRLNQQDQQEAGQEDFCGNHLQSSSPKQHLLQQKSIRPMRRVWRRTEPAIVRIRKVVVKVVSSGSSVSVDNVVVHIIGPA